MNYKDIFLQSNTYKILFNDIINNKISNAYLFVSKDSLLLNEYAKFFVYGIINSGDNTFSGISWNKIVNKNSADVIWFPKNADIITSEEVGDIINTNFIIPLENDKKIIILQNFDMMRIDNQNKLLKTLEEACPSSVFIILASNLDNVIATIRSRCKKIILPKLSNTDIKEFLSDKVKGNLDIITEFSLGSIKNAFEIDKKNTLSMIDLAISIYDKLLKGGDVVVFSNKIIALKENVDEFLEIMINILHLTCLQKFNANNGTNNEYSIKINQLSKVYNNKTIKKILDNLLFAKKSLLSNCNVTAVIDSLLFKILEVKQAYGQK